MITINIPARAAALAGVIGAAIFALFATDALGSGDPPEQVQGDVTCDGLVDGDDALQEIRHLAGLEVQQQDPCTAIGEVLSLGGPSVLYANVRGNGSIISGDAIAVERPSPGVYEIAFAEDVSDCAPVLTVGNTGDGGAFNPNAAVAAHVGISEFDPSEVRVNIRSADPPNDTGDSDFHLIVAC